MNINPGEFNKKIEIIAITRTFSEGFATESENTVLTCWAKVSNTSGTELMKANADFVEVKTRFLIRYPSVVINEDMIVRFGGIDYNMTYINDYDFANKYIEIWGTRKEMV